VRLKNSGLLINELQRVKLNPFFSGMILSICIYLNINNNFFLLIKI